MKLILTASLAASAGLLLSGCASDNLTPRQMTTNIAGIYTVTQRDYVPARPATFNVTSEELMPRTDFSGDKHTFLWGLITFTDY